jgi:bifunctional non-homologous end joining protein LigD
LEGIMAKRNDSIYSPGKRTSAWLKIKVRETHDCYVIGYTKGMGNRASTFGALQLAQTTPGGWVYRGKVGTGFDDDTLKELTALLKKQKTAAHAPVDGNWVDANMTTWVQPVLLVEISCSQITTDGMFREPVFVRYTLSEGV